MKRLIICLVILSIFSLSTVASAHGPGMMGGGQQEWQYCPYCGQPFGQGGYGMMGGGMMGSGMMGRGGMMGGYGMGHGMMGGGMMGRGGMMGGGYEHSEECQKFFDQNAGPRKELNSKRFDYYEAARNPKTTPETLSKLENEIRELQEKIYAKAPQACWAR